MVRLEEMSPSLFSNHLENKPLSSSLSSLRQSNSDKTPSLPSLHTFPSQMHTFPSPPNRDMPSSHVLNIPKDRTSSGNGGREKHRKNRGNKMAALNCYSEEDEKHGSKLQQGVIVKMHLASQMEGRLLRHANRRREVTCLTLAWCHQQPFGREVVREVRRLYRIPREVAVLGWLLAGGERMCRAMLWLLFKLPLPNVVQNLFRMLDEATCGGLQWVESTRQAARRGERCPAWRRVVGALVAAGVAPAAVLWGRWHSRQQRLFLQEAGVLCPPSEDSQRGVLGTTADILLEIMAEISAAFLGRAETEQNHHPPVAHEPALDAVAEEDEEGCYGYDDPNTEGEDTIPLWELCWPDDEVVMGRKTNDWSNEEMKLSITNDMDTPHRSTSNKKLTPDGAVSNEFSGTTYTEDARRLSSHRRRNYNNEMDEDLPSSGGLFPALLPRPPFAFSPHTSSLTLPWSLGVEGSTFSCRSQDPAWKILFQLYCSLFSMMLMIPMLLMTVVRPDRHHEENYQRSWSSVPPDHAQTHHAGQWNDVQPQQSWRKAHKSDQTRRPNFSSSSCDDVWEDGVGKKNTPSNSRKVSQETRDFIEPGLSDYEEEMWLQLGITPQQSKKEEEKIDIKQTHEDDFETWLNKETKEKLEDTPDANYLDDIAIFHNRDNVEFENGVRSKANNSGQFATHMPQEFTDLNIDGASMTEEKNVTTKLSEQFHNGRGSDEGKTAQNSACESKKPSLTRSFTYILRTKSDNLDSYSIPEASINLTSDYDVKAVKDQTNCKTRTELFYADNVSEIPSSDFKNNADVTNRSTQSKTALPKSIQSGAKIGKQVTRKLQTKSNLSSGINFPQKLHEDKFMRTDNSSPTSSPSKPIGKLNHTEQKTNALETSEKKIFCSSGMSRSGTAAPMFKAQALCKQAHSSAKTRMNGSIVDKKQTSEIKKQKILNKNHSSNSKMQSCIKQQKDHKPWRSCCMNSQNIYKETCCGSSKTKNHEKTQ